jgi:hypothetical protein
VSEGELEETARAQHAVRLTERGLELRHVHEAGEGHREVEGVVREGQLHRAGAEDRG